MWRRLIAGLTILLGALANAETLIGTVRDGDVHHETVATALAHKSLAPGIHDHPDTPGSSDGGSGPGHQHGTAADHCTHHHGAALPSPGLLLGGRDAGVRPQSLDPDSQRGVDSLAAPPPKA